MLDVRLTASKRLSGKANLPCRDQVPEVTSSSKQLRSNAGLRGRSPTEIVDSIPAGGMIVCLVSLLRVVR